MAYYNARSCNYLYIAGYRIDTNTQRGFKSFRYSEVYRQIRRTRTWPCLVIDRFYSYRSEANWNYPFGFKGNGEGLARKGGWGAFLLSVLFAMAFCPTSGVFYFGILIPMSATTVAGYLLPVAFAIATAFLGFDCRLDIGIQCTTYRQFYGKMQTVQKWLNRIVGSIFAIIGLYYCVIMYL